MGIVTEKATGNKFEAYYFVKEWFGTIISENLEQS